MEWVFSSTFICRWNGFHLICEIQWCYQCRCHVWHTDVMNVDVSSVFFRHLHLWHQCFRHDIYIDDISVFHMISIFMTSVFFRHLHRCSNIYLMLFYILVLSTQGKQQISNTYKASCFNSQRQKNKCWYCHHFLYNCKNVTVLLWNECFLRHPVYIVLGH
jgi:hypothetical protein